jgi:hypothetical protein
MLGKTVILCEGISEKDIILTAAAKLESADPDKYYPLDLLGVSVLSVDGDGKPLQIWGLRQAPSAEGLRLLRQQESDVARFRWCSNVHPTRADAACVDSDDHERVWPRDDRRKLSGKLTAMS